jgi:hypothetical protein
MESRIVLPGDVQNTLGLITEADAKSQPVAGIRSGRGPLRFSFNRINDNECILFDEAQRESWIIYPPRSAYSHVSRPDATSTVVEHHPWEPFSVITQHVVQLTEGCVDHGLECDASAAVRAAAEIGWNAFV